MTDPAETAAAVMAKAEALLVEVRQARIALTATPEGPERTVYLGMLESFEKGLLAALWHADHARIAYRPPSSAHPAAAAASAAPRDRRATS